MRKIVQTSEYCTKVEKRFVKMRFHTLQVIKKNLGSTVAGENKREKIQRGAFLRNFLCVCKQKGYLLDEEVADRTADVCPHCPPCC